MAVCLRVEDSFSCKCLMIERLLAEAGAYMHARMRPRYFLVL